MHNKSYLDNIYYDIGSQVCEFDVSKAFIKEGQVLFLKWIPYFAVQSDMRLLESLNQRTQLTCEINFELDSPTIDINERLNELNELSKRLDKDNIKQRIYTTEDGRARRIETFWLHLAQMTKQEREELREKLIAKYNCDRQLKSDKHMVSFGIHFKTNKQINLIRADEGYNIHVGDNLMRNKYKQPKKIDEDMVANYLINEVFYDENAN